MKEDVSKQAHPLFFEWGNRSTHFFEWGILRLAQEPPLDAVLIGVEEEHAFHHFPFFIAAGMGVAALETGHEGFPLCLTG